MALDNILAFLKPPWPSLDIPKSVVEECPERNHYSKEPWQRRRWEEAADQARGGEDGRGRQPHAPRGGGRNVGLVQL